MNANQIYNNDAEKAVIGYILVNPGDYQEIGLSPDDFYVGRHQTIWSAVGDLIREGKSVDFITIQDKLNQLGKLAEVGGPGELAGLIAYPYLFEARDAAEIIRDMARRRELVQIASDIAKAAYDLGQKLDTGAVIDRLSRTSGIQHGAEHWSRFLSALYDDIERRAQDPKSVWGIATGFSRFDKVTGGLQRGESLILSGKPGMGKSMLAMQMAEQMAGSSPGALYSIEMTGLSVARRIVSAHSRVQVSSLKSGYISADAWTDVTKAIGALASKPVYMSDASSWTTTSLMSDLARLKARHGITWFVFDYMLLAGDAPSLDRNERTEVISRNMKLICRNLDLAGLIVHSMNKAGIDATSPDMANLSGSGQVAYDADLIVFLNPFTPMETSDVIRDADKQNMRTLMFAKGRELEDPRKYLHLVKLKDYPMFGDYMPEPGTR